MCGGTAPSMFITFGFFEHEMQTTMIRQGSRVDFDFTAKHVVNVDDFFLSYIQRGSMPLELHRAIGTEFQTMATGTVRNFLLIDYNWHIDISYAPGYILKNHHRRASQF